MQNNSPVFLLSSSQVIVFASISRIYSSEYVGRGQDGFCKEVGGRGWDELPVIYVRNSLQLPPS